MKHESTGPQDPERIEPTKRTTDKKRLGLTGKIAVATLAVPGVTALGFALGTAGHEAVKSVGNLINVINQAPEREAAAAVGEAVKLDIAANTRAIDQAKSGEAPSLKSSVVLEGVRVTFTSADGAQMINPGIETISVDGAQETTILFGFTAEGSPTAGYANAPDTVYTDLYDNHVLTVSEANDRQTEVTPVNTSTTPDTMAVVDFFEQGNPNSTGFNGVMIADRG